MKRFIALYMAPVGLMDEFMAKLSPEEKEKMGKESVSQWNEWIARNEDSFEYPMHDNGPVGQNKRVASDGGVSDVRNELVGYSIIQAESHDVACKVVKDTPFFRGGDPRFYIDVSAILDAEEM